MPFFCGNGIGDCLCESRIAATEPVDGLLSVAHPIALLNHFGQSHENLYLNRRAVLELVHEQVGIGAAYLGSNLLVLEQLVHVMLNVVEIHNALVELVLRVLLVPFLCQSEDGADILFLQVEYLLAAP